MKIDDPFLAAVFTYNNLDGLESTIRSLYCQTYPSIALYISDDHSRMNGENVRDRIEAIVKPYRHRFIAVTININSHNMGTVRHINLVLRSTKERCFCLLGSGDRLFGPDTIKDVMYFFRKHPNLDICVSKRRLQLSKAKSIVLPPQKIVKRLKEGDLDRILNLCCRDVNYITTIGTFFLRDLFERYGEFDENYVLLEDAPYFLNLMFAGEPFGFLDKVACVHLAGGISNRIGSNPILEADSVRTLVELKYPRRFQLSRFSRRVVTVKYLLRCNLSLRSIVKCLFLYPEAVFYLFTLVVGDWITRKRFLRKEEVKIENI